MTQTLRIGTRGSDLALWQAHHVRDRLLAAHPGLAVDIVVIKTTGDQIRDRPLADIGGKGLFVKEIEEALLDRRVDLAIHSLKDMPVEAPDGLELSCFPGRAEPWDVLCPRDPSVRTLADLPRGATVATGSARRQLQLLDARPDLHMVGLRGNVPTRLSRRFDPAPGFDAVVLAEAGVRRLGLWEDAFVRLEPPTVIPASCQGTLSIETRVDDARTLDLVAPLDDRTARLTAAAERACLALIEGDCHTPFAAHAAFVGDTLRLVGRLYHDDGSHTDGEASGVVSDEAAAATIGREVGRQLRS